MKAIYLAPFGSIDESVMNALENCLWQIFGFEVKRLSNMPEPNFALDKNQNQYNSTLLLKNLLKDVPNDALKVLGVTQFDLFIPMLSFVFGHAQVNGTVAVISLARLHQQFYNLPENSNIFLHRVMKEAVHEIGHTFGLLHCPEPHCAMSLSNAIQQVDKKSEELCANCLIRYEDIAKHIYQKNTMEIHS